MKKLNKKNRKGFTLVELVVVILIIAILASATFLGGATVIKQSRVTKAQNDIGLYVQYAQYMLYENPSYAGKGDEPNENFDTPIKQADAFNKYLTSDIQIVINDNGGARSTEGLTALKDSWDNPYQINVIKDDYETGINMIIKSFGPDARGDTSDDICVSVSLDYDGEVKVVYDPK